MNTEVLNDIEAKLDELIKRYQKLQVENSSLKAKEQALEAECSRLIEKNEKARTRVEAMLVHIRNLDTNPEKAAS